MDINKTIYILQIDKFFWENDYINNTLLKNINKEIILIPKRSLFYTKYYKKLICKNKNITNNNIFIILSNLFFIKKKPDKYKNKNSFELLKEYKLYDIISLIKPKIIILLSDEWGNKPELNYLSKYTNLLLRQHTFKNYKIFHNIIHVPLGYMHNMLEDNYESVNLKLPKDRIFKWSFIGNIKQDRKKMINIFSKIKPHFYEKIEPNKIKDIYRESIFVPVGRGSFRLDCFRIYEAIVCGAIPLICGNKSEIDETFKYMNNIPLIYENTWDKVLNKCNILLEDMNYLEKYQKNLLKWWSNIISKINKQIILNLK